MQYILAFRWKLNRWELSRKISDPLPTLEITFKLSLQVHKKNVVNGLIDSFFWLEIGGSVIRSALGVSAQDEATNP